LIGLATAPAQTYRAYVDAGTESYKLRRFGESLESYLAAAELVEVAPADLCMRIAGCYRFLNQPAEALRWTLAVVDAGDDFAHWQAAAAGLDALAGAAAAKRTARVAVLGSYTTAQFVPMLRLASRRIGMDLQTYECHYGQYRQEILDPNSGLYEFRPDVVLLAVHESEVALPSFSAKPGEDVRTEAERWMSLWRTFARHSSARLVHHTFAIAPENSWGHLGSQLRGSRQRMLQDLNLTLGEEAQHAPGVSIVDCDRLAAAFGKERWFNPRYWDLAKQGVALEALPLLSRHTAAVFAAGLGLSRKCLVLDLDNTLWGGVIGEDGLSGIKVGDGPQGEGFLRFQQYLLELKEKGVLLAVCSKNNEADAIQPFEQHSRMQLRTSDFAAFVANWNPKPDNLREISGMLNIGIDSLVFFDDNPVERQAVRQALPEVDVIPVPSSPSEYVRSLSRYLLFETASFTEEDANRTEQYRARARMSQMAESVGSLDDLHRSLHMQAVIEPFSDAHLDRVVQLIGKTNQFNVTTRRYSAGQIREFMADPDCIHATVQLRDTFADHGLISIAIAFVRGDILDIDTWLMSCRVIGRRVEDELLSWLCEAAVARNCTKLRGVYIPTAKNGLVRDLYSRFDFEPSAGTQQAGGTAWVYDIARQGRIQSSGFIAREETLAAANQ
jgi:FkbH-like protein